MIILFINLNTLDSMVGMVLTIFPLLCTLRTASVLTLYKNIYVNRYRAKFNKKSYDETSIGSDSRRYLIYLLLSLLWKYFSRILVVIRHRGCSIFFFTYKFISKSTSKHIQYGIYENLMQEWKYCFSRVLIISLIRGS